MVIVKDTVVERLSGKNDMDPLYVEIGISKAFGLVTNKVVLYLPIKRCMIKVLAKNDIKFNFVFF